MTAYADTSFLVSLYTHDINSARAAASFRRAKGVFVLTTFGEFELLNALEQRVFRKELGQRDAEAGLRAVRDDVVAGVFLRRPIPEALYQRAQLLARRHTRQIGARALDILHVAAAVTLKAERFYTFDQRQARLARAAGLRVLPAR